MATYKTGFGDDPKAAGDKQAPPELMRQWADSPMAKAGKDTAYINSLRSQANDEARAKGEKEPFPKQGR